ncbi:tetratricopeptide repeat protein [Planctomycetota bacterium]
MSSAGNSEDIQLYQPWYPGKVIEGLYRITEEIARGGMGVVHKATDLATNNIVVIKSLLPQVAQIDEYKQRFIREAEEWVALGAHPNIVRAHTAHEIEYLPRLILEFIDGKSLYDIIYDEGLPPLEQALDIAIQMCWGVTYAHDRGVTHRDLKPDNIMVSAGGVVKVTDFGLVKRMFEKGDNLVSQGEELPPLQTLMTQGILGTPEYIAPEQWQGDASQSSDIYSFGIILYELFCGQRPFDYSHLKGHERITAYQTAHYQEEPPAPRTVAENLPPPIETLIRMCLEKEPGNRPKSFRQITMKINTIAKQIIGQSFRKAPQPEELTRHEILDQANGYLRLGVGCSFRSDFERALDLLDKALVIFNKLNYQKGIGNYCRIRGNIYLYIGNYDQAMKMYQKSLDIFEILSDQEGISKACNNIGMIFSRQNNYDRAMEIYHKSLEIAEGFDDQLSISYCCLNIGIIFLNQGNNDRAMEMFQRSLEISEVLGNQEIAGKASNNIGMLLWQQGDNDRAMEMYQKSLQISEALGDQVSKSSSQLNMGIIFMNQGLHGQAMEMFQESQKISSTLGDQTSLCFCSNNMGMVYMKQGNCSQALEMFKESLEISESLKDKRMASSNLFEMGQVYSKQGHFAKAIEHLHKSLAIMKEIDYHRQSEVEELIAELKEQKSSGLRADNPC